MKRYNKYLVFLIMLFVISTIGTVGIAMASDSYSFEEINLDGEYYVNQTFTVPSIKAVSNGNTYDTVCVLQFPDGSSVIDDGDDSTPNEVRLTMTGKYKLKYSAVIDNKTVYKTAEFFVNQKLFTVSSSDSALEYGLENLGYDSEMTGLNLKLSAGDTFNYNKVVDLSKMSGSDTIFKFYAMPNENGKMDVSGITLSFTDAYDPTNVVEIQVKGMTGAGDASSWDWAYASVAAVGIGQVTTGYTPNTPPYVQVNTVFGAGTLLSFYGDSKFGQGLAKDRPCEIMFDLESRQAMVKGNTHSAPTLIADLDDPYFFPSHLWNGFTTGEVFVSLRGNTYYKNTANLFISNVCGEDLSKLDTNVSQDIKPYMEIDNNGVDIDNAFSVKGYKFPVFKATAKSAYEGELPVSVKAYNGYYSSLKTELDIVDDCFICDNAGIVTLEYSVIRHDGSIDKELIDIQVYEDQLIDIETTGEYTITAKAGDRIKIADFNVKNNIGKVQSELRVTSNGKEVPVENGIFKAVSKGIYQVSITATDLIGQKKVLTYNVEVAGNGIPSFFEDVAVPDYFLVGKTYTFPIYYAYDYSSDVEKQITTKVRVNGVESSTFTAQSEGDVTVEYIAETSTGSNTKTYHGKAVDVGGATSLNLIKYFDSDGFTPTLSSSQISFVANDGVSSAETKFINYLPSNSFTVETVINPEKKEFDTLDFYLIDVIDGNNVIKISIDGGSFTARINDGTETLALTEELFDQTGETALKIQYDDSLSLLKIGNDSLVVKNHTPFSEGVLKLKIVANGIKGDCSFALRKICNQVLRNTIKKDNIKPMTTLGGKYPIYASIGKTLTVFRAFNVDVLSPVSNETVRVKSPDGKTLVSVDGINLDNVASNRDYSVPLDQYGIYTVEYFVRDSADNTVPYLIQITVKDETPPTIKINSDYKKTVKIGSVVRVPEYTVSDNLEGEIKVLVIVKNKFDGFRKLLSGNEFKVTEKTVYEITYICSDMAGNVVFHTIEINVEE